MMKERIRIFFRRARQVNAHELAVIRMYQLAVDEAETAKMSCIKLGLMKKAGEYLQEQIAKTAVLDAYKAELRGQYVEI